MRLFIATVHKRRIRGDRRLPPEVESRIAKALANPPWGAAATTRRDGWVATSNTVRVDVVSNEPDTTGPLIHRYPGRAAAWTGHLDDPSFSGDDPTAGTVAGLPGRFALVAADDDRAVGYTTVHRIEPLYVGESRDLLVLSNSARAAHLAAGLPAGRPPLGVLIGLSGPGFMLNDLTPFHGVEAVAAASYVTLSPSGKESRPLPTADIDPDTPLEILADQVAEALVGSAAALGRMPWERTVHVTGGKDSRVAAAALAAAGVSFVATTTGVDTHPDVVVGRRVANVIGVAHEVKPPVGTVVNGDAVEVNPLRRAHSVLRGCDGMLTAYETVSIRGPYRDNAVTLGGHGGELLRGGFAYGVPSASPAAIRRRLENRTAPHRQLLTEEAQIELDRMVAPWADLIAADPHRGSERFYRELRTGRWHAVANSVYGIGGPRRSILADNRVVRTVSAGRQDLAAQERLVHAVLHRLHPDLCTIPLFPKRWNFEKSGPTTECDPDGWRTREPPLGDRQMAWNWKVSYPPTLHRHLADAILSAPLYDTLLDKPQVERFLHRTLTDRTAAQAYQMWSLYTTSQLVAGLGSKPAEPGGPTIRIPLPRAIPE